MAPTWCQFSGSVEIKGKGKPGLLDEDLECPSWTQVSTYKAEEGSRPQKPAGGGYLRSSTSPHSWIMGISSSSAVNTTVDSEPSSLAIPILPKPPFARADCGQERRTTSKLQSVTRTATSERVAKTTRRRLWAGPRRPRPPADVFRDPHRDAAARWTTSVSSKQPHYSS